MHSAVGCISVVSAAGPVPSSWGNVRASPPLGGGAPVLVGRERLRGRGGGGGRVVLCPPLRGIRPSPEYNLKTHCEDEANERAYLLDEWDYDANDDKEPEEFTRGSQVKVWWRCRTCGREWDARIGGRTRSKNPSGCPACAGRVATDANNFEVWCEKNGKEALLAEWAHKSESPTEFTFASNEKVPWRCRTCGRGWDATISSRTRSKNPSGCPACAGRVATDANNFEVWCEKNGKEALLAEWAHKSESPTEFTFGSDEKVPWRCQTCECEWDARIGHRTKSKNATGCPACSGTDRRGEGAGYVVKDLLLCAASGDLDPGNAGCRERQLIVAIKFGTTLKCSSWEGDTLFLACHRRFKRRNDPSYQHSNPPVPGDLCSYFSSSILYPNGNGDNLGHINTIAVYHIPDKTSTVERKANSEAIEIIGPENKIPHRIEFHDMNHPSFDEAYKAHAASWAADGVTLQGHIHYYSDVRVDALRAWADREGHALVKFEYGNERFGRRTFFYRIEEAAPPGF